jgi:hypothetical protein
MTGTYRDDLTMDRKRAVRKKASSLIIEEGEIYVKRKNGNVSFLCYSYLDCLTWIATLL